MRKIVPGFSNFNFWTVLLFFVCGIFITTSSQTLPTNSQLKYKATDNWAKLPNGRTWGQVAGVSIDSHGHIWVFERCGSDSCVGRTEDPIMEFDSSGRLLQHFGSGMFVFPHGIYVDKHDDVWVTDGRGSGGKGQDVIKFSPEGKVLLTLGTPGVAGDGENTFNRPSAVVVAPNGDIFVADGHVEPDSNSRIVKFSKDGKFIKTWGKRGSAPGDLKTPHSIAMDSRGRLFVADWGNNRIQVFDQDGKSLEQWTEFGRPSGVFIDKNDVMYVCDNTDNRYPTWKRGIRIGSTKDGKVMKFIPDTDQSSEAQHNLLGAESLMVDQHGNIFAADVKRQKLLKYIKQ